MSFVVNALSTPRVYLRHPPGPLQRGNWFVALNGQGDRHGTIVDVDVGLRASYENRSMTCESQTCSPPLRGELKGGVPTETSEHV